MKLRIDYRGILFLTIGLGCLQIVLDRGHSENWFDSRFITTLAIISASSLILFIIVELFTDSPIVNLRVFKDLSFSTGNMVMFFAFFNLFGSIVLLPIYLQTLMGYTATLAGMVLGPGGLVTLIVLPITGRLVHKIDPRIVLGGGILICSYAAYLMSNFNLQADFWSIIWPRVVLGAGMPFIFVALTLLTMAGIRKEEMGNATSIYNLLRNLGGSFGVAFVTTMLQRRTQFHQFRLVENISIFDPSFQITHENLTHLFELKGFGPLSEYAGLSSIYKEIIRQATMLGFNDAFHVLSVMMIVVFFLIFLLKIPSQRIRN